MGGPSPTPCFLLLLLFLPVTTSSGGGAETPCGATLRNATRGRLETPGKGEPGDALGGNWSCRWLLEAPPGHRLRLSFQRLLLDEDSDRLSIRGGPSPLAPLLFDSDLDEVPLGGVLSPQGSLSLELLSEGPRQRPPRLQLTYDAFPAGGCPPPRLPHGGVLSSHPPHLTPGLGYPPGALVSFHCLPGYVLRGGPQVLLCLGSGGPGDPPGTPPHWNDSQPLCTAQCGGVLPPPPGVVPPPPPPPAPQDCVWSLRLPEESRGLLRLHSLSLAPNESLTLLDGEEEISGGLLGHFQGGDPAPHPPLSFLSTGSDLIIHFRGGETSQEEGGDPLPKRELQPFEISYEASPRTDSCPPLPAVAFGRLLQSRRRPLRGAVVTFQCQEGFRLLGPELLTCNWDLRWSHPPPACRRVLRCPPPREVPGGRRKLGGPGLGVGSRLRFSCPQGFVLQGTPTLTCRPQPGGPPRWSHPAPSCVWRAQPCLNPGVPANGYQALYKPWYQAGESLRFSCLQGFLLLGEVTSTCLPGSPPAWSSQPPLCRAADPHYRDESSLQVAQGAGPGRGLGGAVAMVTLLPLLLLIGGGCFCYGRFPGKALLGSHSYSPIRVESDFTNPLYEPGDSREYEVSI